MRADGTGVWSRESERLRKLRDFGEGQNSEGARVGVERSHAFQIRRATPRVTIQRSHAVEVVLMPICAAAPETAVERPIAARIWIVTRGSGLDVS